MTIYTTNNRKKLHIIKISINTYLKTNESFVFKLMSLTDKAPNIDRYMLPTWSCWGYRTGTLTDWQFFSMHCQNKLMNG